jgi:tRNA(Ile)-lysidine synthase TilS/MesJ
MEAQVIITGFIQRVQMGLPLAAMKSLSKLKNKINLYRPLLDTKKKFLTKISKNVFGTYFKDPSNNDLKYLRTKVRNLQKPLEKSCIVYEKIIKSINSPLISSSANISGDSFPKTIYNISSSILNAVDVIINFDVKSSGKPSSVIKINKDQIEYLRK